MKKIVPDKGRLIRYRKKGAATGLPLSLTYSLGRSQGWRDAADEIERLRAALIQIRDGYFSTPSGRCAGPENHEQAAIAAAALIPPQDGDRK